MLRDLPASPYGARFHPSRLLGLENLLLASVLGAGLLLAAGGAAAQGQPSAKSPTLEGQGKRYYDTICAKCHEAGIGPVITGRGLDPVIYTTIVRYGNRAMPAFRVTDIDDATLQDLANYLSKTPEKTE